MLNAPIPGNEPERLASLRRMLLLSSPDEEAFDRVTRVARHTFRMPVVLISLIDAERQWFKSCIGLPVRETGRDVSFCGHAILHSELLVIEDARLDPRFADNPLVTGEPRVIFYAGRPLMNAEGFMVGTLCLIDHQPRTLSAEDRRCLDDLGCWVEQLFLSRRLGEVQQAFMLELDEARRTSLLDPLLNIWHREAAMDMLERETQRAFRNRSPLAVLMIEPGRLAEIRHAHGAAAGDDFLVEFLRRLRSLTRPYDTIGRYGDDRFIVTLPDGTAATARSIAERLIRAMAYPFAAQGELIETTVSIGISAADFVTATPSPLEALDHAEEALRTARARGGNHLEIHENH